MTTFKTAIDHFGYAKPLTVYLVNKKVMTKECLIRTARVLRYEICTNEYDENDNEETKKFDEFDNKYEAFFCLTHYGFYYNAWAKGKEEGGLYNLVNLPRENLSPVHYVPQEYKVQGTEIIEE